MDAYVGGSDPQDEGFADDKNPFKMLTDEEIFALRDEEKMKKKEDRDKLKDVPIWQKTTWSSRMGVQKITENADEDPANSRNSKLGLVAAATRDRRKEKENMSEFIAKKR